MENTKTRMIYGSTSDYTEETGIHGEQPVLFVCSDHEIMEFPLSGHQLMGRPVHKNIPDIPVVNRYVSRCQGCFDTEGSRVFFTAADATNRAVINRRMLNPGEKVELKDGDEIIIPTSVGDDVADVMLVCAIYEQRINIWRELRLASRDALTGLAGRNTFRTWYLQHFHWKDIDHVCLFIMDIDFFKRINDVYGHPAGDEALKFLSKELTAVVGGTGYVCRWGGDEFVGIMLGNTEEVSRKLGEMSERMKNVKIEDRFTFTVSAGVVDVKQIEEIEDIDSAIVLADKALYRAKEDGKSRICVYKPGEND